MKKAFEKAACHSGALAPLSLPEVVACRPSKCSECEKPPVAKGFCQRHYDQDRYQRNAEKIKARARKFRQENPDIVRQRWDEWERKNPGKARESQRKWAKNNPEKVLNRKRRWVQNNREHVNSSARKLTAKNRDKRRVQRRKRYLSDPEKHRAASKRSYHKDPAKWIKRHKQWLKDNPEKAREVIRLSRQKRAENDPAYRIRMNLSRRIVRAVKAQYADKAYKTMEVLGCSIPEFMAHIEAQFQPGMNWQNHGMKETDWQLDHIIPCAKFDLTLPEHQKRCFHFSNYQPLWTPDNRKKWHHVPADFVMAA